MNGQEEHLDIASRMQYKGSRYNIQLNRYKVKSGKQPVAPPSFGLKSPYCTTWSTMPFRSKRNFA